MSRAVSASIGLAAMDRCVQCSKPLGRQFLHAILDPQRECYTSRDG
jgi:hypothetical protein